MEELLKLLEEIRPNLDFSKQERLIDDGLLDSFDIITIVAEINDVFGVRINVADLVPENMNSAKAMWEMINRRK